MERTFGDRWLLTAIGTITTVVTTTFLIIRPLPLPDWVPGVSPAGESTVVADPSQNGLGQSFFVTPGDGRLTISWTTADGASLYRADAVPEGDAPLPIPCQQVAGSSSVGTSTCVLTGLSNGAPYLISVRPVDGADSVVPTRMARAVPRPALLTSPDVTAWFDASDYATIRPDHKGQARVGSRVMILRDKSPHHFDAQQSDTAQEPTIGQLGTLPALTLDGDDIMFADGRSFPAGNRPSTVLVVAAQDDRSPDATCLHNLLSWGVPKIGEARILHKGCRSPLAFAETWGTHVDQDPTQRWPTGQAALVSAVFDSTGTSLRLNGTLSYTWKANPDERMNTTGDTFGVGGSSWDAKGGWVGRIGEIVVFNRLLNVEELRSVERYMAVKWHLLLDPR